MPDFVMEPIYCSQQIIIPPTFPHLLKVFAKAAIRTQPYDLLLWSASYFRALSDGSVPPAKERLEYPLLRSEGGLSPGYLKLLIKKLSIEDEIEFELLRKRWLGICLKEKELKEILCTAGVYLTEKFPLYKFAAVAAGFLTKSLTHTMIMLCEIYTDEPDGASAAISADFFVDLYTFLAAIDASTEVTYYDGYRQEIYLANEAEKKDPIEIVQDEEQKTVEKEPWIPKLRGWIEQPTVLETNIILGEPLPIESAKLSRNLTLMTRPRRENFTEQYDIDSKETILTASEESKTHTQKEASIETLEADIDENKHISSESTPQDDNVESPVASEEEIHAQSAENEVEAAPNDEEGQTDVPTEVKKEIDEETVEKRASKLSSEADDSNKSSNEDLLKDKDEDEQEDAVKPIGKDHGISLRVFSEAGEKIHSLSATSQLDSSVTDITSNEASDDETQKNDNPENNDEKEDEGEEEEEGEEINVEENEGIEEQETKKKHKKDISVKEREAVIEQLEKNKEKKVNDFLDAIESLETLVEKTKMLQYDADKIGGRELVATSGEIIAATLQREFIMRVERPEKQDPHIEAKGVVNPLLNEFYNQVLDLVTEEKDTHVPEIVIVQPKPGIGPTVDQEIIDEFLKYVREMGADQCDMFMPRDIRHCLCPPLEKPNIVESIV